NEQLEEENVGTEETTESIQEEVENKEEAASKNEEKAANEQESESTEKPKSPIENWRNLREAKDRAEQEAAELRRLLQERSQTKPQQESSQQESVEEPQFGDDDLIEGKHLKSYSKKYEKHIQNLEQRLIEQQIKSQYPDFDKVVNKETLEMLRDSDPDLADSIAANPNLMSKANAAYKAIKRAGFIESNTHQKGKEKVQENINKPRPVSSISPQQGKSPLSRANAFAEGLTPELKEQLWKEIKECSE
ncbi:MAG: hypothetical protein ACOC80_11070, partial [Petrotogales bacterium]